MCNTISIESGTYVVEVVVMLSSGTVEASVVLVMASAGKIVVVISVISPSDVNWPMHEWGITKNR